MNKLTRSLADVQEGTRINPEKWEMVKKACGGRLLAFRCEQCHTNYFTADYKEHTIEGIKVYSETCPQCKKKTAIDEHQLCILQNALGVPGYGDEEVVKAMAALMSL